MGLYIQNRAKLPSPKDYDPDFPKLTKTPSKYIKEHIPVIRESCARRNCKCPKYHVVSEPKYKGRSSIPPPMKNQQLKDKMQLDNIMILVQEKSA